MNKNEFINELRHRLRYLPPDEIENAVSYYEEYFNEWAYYGNEDENEIRYVIRGYITNNSKKEISFLYFTFKVFDENENHLGYAPVSLRNLSPGETHKLVATYRKENDEEVSTFRPSATAYYNVGNQYEDMTCISLDLEIKNKDDIISLRDGKYTIDRATLKGEFIESDEGAHHDKFLITGNITNNSNMYAEELGLGFKLFDMNGIVIATIGAGIYFEAGETQEIKTWLIGKEARRVDSFELRNANFAHWLPR